MMRNAHPLAIGAIEASLPGQFLYNTYYNMLHDGRATDPERELCARVLPMASLACREPFIGMSAKMGDVLISAGADMVRICKEQTIQNGVIRPVSYILSQYYWLNGVLDDAHLTLSPGSAYDDAWEITKAEMLRHEDIMEAVDRSARKRARKWRDLMATFGLFARKPIEVAA